MTKTFKIHSIDNGFCRVNYKGKTRVEGTRCYCLQDEGKNYGGVILYRCSRDWEPNYPITLHPQLRKQFEVPAGDTQIEIAVREFLTKE
jgi:hypothetical protein